MPKVSRFDLDDERMAELIGQLWNGFTLLEDRNEVKVFLSKFFSPTEIQMFAKRLEMLKLADSDLEVSQLHKLLHLSRATIYDWLEKHDAYEEEFHIVIDKLKKLDQDYLDRISKKIEKASEMHGINRSTTDYGPPKSQIKSVKISGYAKRQKRKSLTKI